MKNGRVVFRVDANRIVGMGHLSRCLNLAKSLRDCHSILFITKNDPICVDKIKSHGYNLKTIDSELPFSQELPEIKAILRSFDPYIIIIDLKHKISTQYVRSLRGHNSKVVILDNFSEGCFASDLSIFPVSHMPPDLLNDKRWKENNAKYVAGASYFPLSERFLKQKRDKLSDDKFSVLVTFGGADPNNIALKVTSALSELKREFNAKVVIGPYADDSGLQVLDSRFEILHNIEDMAPIMATADVAITAFGVTLYELAYMGVPQIIIYNYLSDKDDANRFKQFGSSISLGYHKDVTKSDIIAAVCQLMDNRDLKRRMSGSAMKLVDGKGADRISHIIEGL